MAVAEENLKPWENPFTSLGLLKDFGSLLSLLAQTSMKVMKNR